MPLRGSRSGLENLNLKVRVLVLPARSRHHPVTEARAVFGRPYTCDEHRSMRESASFPAKRIRTGRAYQP
jgi:hypothetical protein